MCPHGYHHNGFMETPALGTQEVRWTVCGRRGESHTDKCALTVITIMVLWRLLHLGHRKYVGQFVVAQHKHAQGELMVLIQNVLFRRFISQLLLKLGSTNLHIIHVLYIVHVLYMYLVLWNVYSEMNISYHIKAYKTTIVSIGATLLPQTVQRMNITMHQNCHPILLS